MNNEELNLRVRRLESLIFKQREYLFHAICPVEFRGKKGIHYFEINEGFLRINEDVVIDLTKSDYKNLGDLMLKIKEVGYRIFLHKEHYEVSIKKLPNVCFKSEWSVPTLELVIKI